MRWWKTWAACVAFYYPAQWVSRYVLFTAPVLLAAFIHGRHLSDFLFEPASFFLWNAPVHLAWWGGGPLFFIYSPWHYWTAVVLIGTLVGATYFMRGTSRLIGGLWAVAAAQTVLLGLIPSEWVGPGYPWLGLAILQSIPILAEMGLGLLWMLSAWELRRYWQRAASLVAAVVLPQLALYLAQGVTPRMLLRPAAIVALAPLIAVCLLVSILAPMPVETTPAEPGWKPAVAGLITTAVMLAAISLSKLASPPRPSPAFFSSCFDPGSAMPPRGPVSVQFSACPRFSSMENKFQF